MFPPMRRKKQLLSPKQCDEIINRNTSGVLALAQGDEYPYAVPLSYAYHDGKIYFHCAQSGHKLDLLANNKKVSFCIIDQDEIIPQKYTTHFASVIIFGQANIITDAAAKRHALEKLVAKYSPVYEKEGSLEIDKFFNQVCVIELAVEHVTGKQAIELVPKRAAAGATE